MSGVRGSFFVTQLLAVIGVLSTAMSAEANFVSGLSAQGTYTPPNPSPFTIGPDGAVFELNAFVLVAGSPPSVQLSSGSLPSSLSLTFTSTLVDSATDLSLVYDIQNVGAVPMSSLRFISFLDAEIDELSNTYFNEYGQAGGTLAVGQDWEIDEPGYAFGDIYDNALAGSLDNSNGVPQASPDDVALALGLTTGPLAPGAIARFTFLISEDGSAIGTFFLRHRDPDPASADTVITFSGTSAIVPEPTSGLLLSMGLWGLGVGCRWTARHRARA
jgi:hypothetical protein